ncbi:hypothetical protein GSY47_15840 [Flavobacterium quisquiliarum]|nr:hypothetical protein [Flavobacterium quisquiliarum]NWK99520.1 hypothetical protein [Flavobacterium collinsii]
MLRFKFYIFVRCVTLLFSEAINLIDFIDV